MAETIVSPGVLAIENDQSFITQGPVQAGAAIVGPTVKGKVGIPTLVTTYSQFVNTFGTTFLSGSQTYSYLTSISAYNYFNNGGTSLLVTRVVSGSTTTDWTPATSSKIPSSTAATNASITLDLTYVSASVASAGSSSFEVNGITFYFTGSNVANTSNVVYLNTASFAASTVANYAATSSAVFTVSSSVAPYSASLPLISSSFSSPNIIFTYIGQNGILGNSNYVVSGSTTTFFSGGTNTQAFVLETLAEGEMLNSAGPTGSNGTLLSGSANNYRWQIVSPNINNGTFTLVIRQGNDTTNSPSILETWSNLSLDPFASNYIERVIGNQIEVVQNDPSTGEYYVQLNGNYVNQSKYVRVKQVNLTTPEYLDNVGNPKPEFTGSIPYTSEGVFGDGRGKNIPTGVAGAYYENISNTNIQGLTAASYVESISLLANRDAYRFNFITAPGLIGNGTNYPAHYSVVNQLVSMVQDRGDSMSIIDIAGYNSNIVPVTVTAIGYDTSYAATYWPWVKTIDPNSGTQVWVPASTLIPGVYAFNDASAEPWFAPAGINRGIITTAIQTERVLTQGNRDLLYESNINSIATFPNTGVVVFGQKTLQKKRSALDRVNVRRLLIELKGYISQVADTFVFEQNNTATRNDFLSIINPYLASVQQREGLTAYRVVMDESNNPPSVVDQNQLIGQIYIQPTRSVEFIILDFNILPTGATFPA
jgi:phage tail sheath protein FI